MYSTLRKNFIEPNIKFSSMNYFSTFMCLNLCQGVHMLSVGKSVITFCHIMSTNRRKKSAYKITDKDFQKRNI